MKVEYTSSEKNYKYATVTLDYEEIRDLNSILYYSMFNDEYMGPKTKDEIINKSAELYMRINPLFRLIKEGYICDKTKGIPNDD